MLPKIFESCLLFFGNGASNVLIGSSKGASSAFLQENTTVKIETINMSFVIFINFISNV
jgi:hypothetical protein